VPNISKNNKLGYTLRAHSIFVGDLHCGKNHRKFPSQITDAADHNKPVTENSGINFPTSLLDCSAIYIGIFSAIYFGIKIS
jgi:hypothetical protein